MKNLPVILLLALLIVSGFMIFVALNSSPEKTTNTPSIKTQQEQTNTNRQTTPTQNQQEQTSTNTQSSGAGGTSSGSSGQQTTSSTNCYLTQIPYALKNLEVNQTCNSLNSEENCTDKTVTCSLEVQNLHATENGNFDINFNFVNADRNVLSSKQTSSIVSADTTATFQIQDFFTTPNANKEITCTFNTIQVPQEKICF